MPLRGGSVAPVDVGSVVDGHDGDDVGDPVDDPEGAAACAVEAFEFAAGGIVKTCGWACHATC